MSTVALYDIGATNTRIAFASGPSTFDSEVTIPTSQGPHGVVNFAEAIKAELNGRKLTAIVGGIASQINRQTDELFHATNLPAWNGRPFVSELANILGVPVIVENDVAMGGMGEAHFGAGRDFDIVMYQTVSTGVNASRIVDGLIDRNAHGVEVGAQLVVGPDGRILTLEAATGGAALERKYGRPPRELAAKGLWSSEAKLLALGLHNTLVHWSPEIVIFGGSMMRDIKISSIQRELVRLDAGMSSEYPPIVLAQLGDLMGLYGALALAAEHNYL